MLHPGWRASYLGLVLHIRHDLLKAVLWLLWVVGTAVKGDDFAPVLGDLLRSERDVDREAVSAGSLPPGLAAPSAAHLVEAPCRVAGKLFSAQSEHKGRNVVRLEGLHHLLGQDGPGHGSAGVGGDGVDIDVVLEAFQRQCSGEAEDT